MTELAPVVVDAPAPPNASSSLAGKYMTLARTITTGILVDQVLEVLNIDAAAIEPPPDLGRASAGGDFILGMGKTAHRVIFLLDISRALSGTEAQRSSAA